MTQPEAFKLLADIRAAVEREGGIFEDDVLAFDHAAPSDPLGFAFLSAHIVTIKFTGAVAAGVFLEKARATLRRLLDRSDIRISLEIGGGKPAKFSLRVGISKASAALRDLSATDDGGSAD